MRGVAVLGALLLLAACAPVDDGVDGRTASPSPSATPSASPSVTPVPRVDDVEGEVVRLRTDEAVGGQVQVRLTAGSALSVSAVALRSPAFADQPLRAVSVAYRPGQTTDLPVPFGAVDCAVAVQPVAAEVVLSRPGGLPETVLVPLTGDALETVHAQECAVQRVLGYVTVAVGEFTDAGDAVAADVVLTRVAGSPDVDVEAVSLARSVLLEPATEDPLPRTLPAGEDELVLTVTVALATCDPHVLAETKKPFVFPLLLQVEGEGAPVDLPLDDAQRADLQALVDRVCS